MERSSSEYPLAPANGYAKSDMEAVDMDSKELRNKKRIKYLLYFIAFCIFQTGVIVLMTFTIMKIRTPKFIMRSASFHSGSFGTDQANPSFNLTMNVQFGVKNTNFGTFKYQDTPVFLYYKGSQVGQVIVPKATALWRSTKKINVFINVNSFSLPPNSFSNSDLSSGVLPITAQSNLNGKVKLVQMFKKKKAIKLNCSLEVNISSLDSLHVNNLSCIT